MFLICEKFHRIGSTEEEILDIFVFHCMDVEKITDMPLYLSKHVNCCGNHDDILAHLPPSLSLSLSLARSETHTLTHSLTNCCCLFIPTYTSFLFSLSLCILSLTHKHTLTNCSYLSILSISNTFKHTHILTHTHTRCCCISVSLSFSLSPFLCPSHTHSFTFLTY